MLKQVLTFKFALVFAVIISFGFVNADHHSDATIYETITEEEELGAFANLVTDSGMDRFLHHEGPYTVLAPNNDAFDELPEDELNDMFNNMDAQQSVLQNHIFQGEHGQEDIAHLIDAEVVDEIRAENGVILVISEVIMEM